QTSRSCFAHRVQEEFGLERAVSDLHEVDIERLEFCDRRIDIRLRSRFQRAFPDRFDALDLRSRAEERRPEQRAARNLTPPRKYLLRQIARTVADRRDAMCDIERQQRLVLLDEIDAAAEVDMHVPQTGNQEALAGVQRRRGLPRLW